MNEEQDRRSHRKVKVRRSPGKTMNTYIGRLHYQITNGSRKRCNFGSL